MWFPGSLSDARRFFEGQPSWGCIGDAVAVHWGMVMEIGMVDGLFGAVRDRFGRNRVDIGRKSGVWQSRSRCANAAMGFGRFVAWAHLGDPGGHAPARGRMAPPKRIPAQRARPEYKTGLRGR